MKKFIILIFATFFLLLALSIYNKEQTYNHRVSEIEALSQKMNSEADSIAVYNLMRLVIDDKRCFIELTYKNCSIFDNAKYNYNRIVKKNN